MTNAHASSDSSGSRLLLNSLTAECGALDDLLQTVARQLHDDCLQGGKLQPGLLDGQQQLAYDLALCSADLAAVHNMLDYVTAREADALEMDVAVMFVADAFQSCLHRLLRSGDKQITVRVRAFYDREGANTLFEHASDPVFQAEVGGRILETNTTRLADTLNQEQALMRDSFARFADEEVAPRAEAIHRQDLDIPEPLLSKAAELGCFGTCIPERFGGFQPDNGADSLGMIVVTEELSRASLGAAGSLITRPEIAARALLAGGTESQQTTWLPVLASGQTLCAIAITEPDTGSDVAAVSLRATPVTGGWVLNGSKTWCTFAGRSELLVVLARSEADQPGHKGLSLFLVEKPAFAGHEFSHQQEGGGKLEGKAIATLGYRGMHSFDLFFNDYFVPDSALVGEAAGRGKGFYYTMAGFAGGRIQTAARAIGVMQAAFEKAMAYCGDRKAFGQPLGNYQLTRIKLARMLSTITACRLFSHAVARLMDTGSGQMQASLVKLFACRAAEWVTREAMQLHGGMGYAEESAVSRYFVDARVLSIFEGAEEVLAIKVVARELMEQAGADAATD